jgi:hypothetical protein
MRLCSSVCVREQLLILCMCVCARTHMRVKRVRACNGVLVWRGSMCVRCVLLRVTCTVCDVHQLIRRVIRASVLGRRRSGGSDSEVSASSPSTPCCPARHLFSSQSAPLHYHSLARFSVPHSCPPPRRPAQLHRDLPVSLRVTPSAVGHPQPLPLCLHARRNPWTPAQGLCTRTKAHRHRQRHHAGTTQTHYSTLRK